MSPTFDEQARLDPKLRDLAGRALNVALRGPIHPGMLEIAERIVLRISLEHPEQGLWSACLMWCDTLQARVPGLSTAEMDNVALAFEEAQTGRRSHADDSVPDHNQWAGRFLMARLRDDPDMALALFRSTTDGWQMGMRVMALLSMAAINIERGQIVTGTSKELAL